MRGPSCSFCRQQGWLLLELFVGMHFWSHLRDYVLVLQSCRGILAIHYWVIHPSVYLFFFRLARSWLTPWFACVYGRCFCIYIMPTVKLVCFDVAVKVALHTACYTTCEVVAVHCLYKIGVYVWSTCLNFFTRKHRTHGKKKKKKHETVLALTSEFLSTQNFAFIWTAASLIVVLNLPAKLTISLPSQVLRSAEVLEVHHLTFVGS